MPREVVAPEGRRWIVQRRLVPWRVRWRGWKRRSSRDDGSWRDMVGELFDFLSWGDDVFAAIGFAIALVVGVALLVLFVVPVAVLLVEVLLVVVLVAAGGVARTLLGRPWIVEARTRGTSEHVETWEVRGWRRSREAVDEIADALEAGQREIVIDQG